MNQDVMERANQACELCASQSAVSTYVVPPRSDDNPTHALAMCKTCMDQLKGEAEIDPNHWRSLNDSMWSEVDAVKVIAWRMLDRMRDLGWPQDLLDMIYLEESAMEWATSASDLPGPKHLDSNGSEICQGDNLVLIKTVDVKGSNVAVKKGDVVKNIRLVLDNTEQVIGRIDGQEIVLLTQYLRKSK
ncbi:MAG: PhnA protein [Bacteroidetes bacterium]|nr:PhnA protein [Bacteroidota bacterium]